MVILGIDPGTRRMGYGVIRAENGRVELLDAGILCVGESDEATLLTELKRGLAKLVARWRPELCAIEKLFFVKNRSTGMAVAQARGVALVSIAEAGVEIVEFSPNEVKSGLTGYGHADKRAMEKMVRLIFARPDLDLIDDAMDALALALYASQSLKIKMSANGKAAA